MTTGSSRELLENARRIVVKVGSSTLTRDGSLRIRKFGDIARQVSSLMEEGREIVLVSSGAIAIGTSKLRWKKPGTTIPEMQAAAAVGQIGLVEHYQRRFAEQDKLVAQVLLTRLGLEDRERYLNARRTLLELLRLGVVPIVNENDTIATEEIRFGDNDNLSANIVSLVAADALVILTDVDGLHVEKPVPGQRKPDLISTVEKITARRDHFRTRGHDHQTRSRGDRRPHGRLHGVVQRRHAGRHIESPSRRRFGNHLLAWATHVEP